MFELSVKNTKTRFTDYFKVVGLSIEVGRSLWGLQAQSIEVRFLHVIIQGCTNPRTQVFKRYW